jgi:ketosteroid isomerase-like protein
MDEALARLIDERDIVRQLHNYCRAVDRCDLALGLGVYHDDATVDYGTMFQGTGHEVIRYIIASHAYLRNHLHRITNIIVEVDGDRAGSETYVDARFRLTQEGAEMEMFTRGRYVDRWEKRDGRWAIAQRTYVHEMDGRRPAGEEAYAVAGIRDDGDPSYAALGLN